MKAVVQRVIDATVTVNGSLKGGIAAGLLVYLGVAREDTTRDADWLIEKIPHLRIFDDENGKMNLSLLDIIVNQQKEVVNNTPVNQQKQVVNATKPPTLPFNPFAPPRLCVSPSRNKPLGILAVSQFTLLGDARKGRRPTWDKAAPPEQARELYRYFVAKMGEKVPCESGEFQAHMQVAYTNDGPVTILLDSAPPIC
jgi:D-tyrosyl-tRNA(Tyr) deacylase